MNSWIMKIWLETHDESVWPDLSTHQPPGACHVTCLEQHPTSDMIEKMCSPDFFSEHEYKYVCGKFGMAGGKNFYLKADGTYPAVYSSCIKLKENPEVVPQKAPNNNDAGYLFPVSITVEDLSSIEGYEKTTLV